MRTADSGELDRLDPRDREHLEDLADAERDVVVSTMLRYRRPSRLRGGDPLPELTLHRLDDGRATRLRDLPDGRPLVLVFGSFT